MHRLVTRPPPPLSATPRCPRCEGCNVAELPQDAASQFHWRACTDCTHLWAIPFGWAPHERFRDPAGA